MGVMRDEYGEFWPMKIWRLQVKWLLHPLRSGWTWRYHREINYKAFMSRKETSEYQAWIAEERRKLEA